MKKTICLLLVMCCVFSLCACGSTSGTPFEGLKDFPDTATVIKRYGDGFKETNSQLIYQTYKFQGYDGELAIFMDEIDGANRAWKAEWKAYPDDVNSAFNKLNKLFNSYFGEPYQADRDSDHFHYYWQDGGYSYGLVKRPSQGYVWAEMSHNEEELPLNGVTKEEIAKTLEGMQFSGKCHYSKRFDTFTDDHTYFIDVTFLPNNIVRHHVKCVDNAVGAYEVNNSYDVIHEETYTIDVSSSGETTLTWKGAIDGSQKENEKAQSVSYELEHRKSPYGEDMWVLTNGGGDSYRWSYAMSAVAETDLIYQS